MFVIPVIRILRQGDYKLEVSLDCIVRLCLTTATQSGIVPSACKVEFETSLIYMEGSRISRAP